MIAPTALMKVSSMQDAVQVRCLRDGCNFVMMVLWLCPCGGWGDEGCVLVVVMVLVMPEVLVTLLWNGVWKRVSIK